MKVIGLLGGMSWESTTTYYRLINEEVKSRLGGLHSARIVLYSVEFQEIERLQHAGDWEQAGRILAGAALALQRAGAEFLVICTNTMHKVAPTIEQSIAIPILHIADATAEVIRKTGVRTVGLLGTRFTMEEGFYVGRLREHHGLDVMIPDVSSREQVHRIIFEELCMGTVLDHSRETYRRIIQDLVNQGAQGIIFGCTEISLLVGPGDSPVPVFDTTEIHAHAAVDLSLDTPRHPG
ncbi:MAG: aspartate/glutamate racemase family protein [Desulfomonilia bacterium]